MENHGIIKISALAAIVAVLPIFVFAYSDETTHPALTQEIVKFYNKSFPERKIGEGDSKIIIRGSVDEDKSPRWLQHFYDPVYNRGLLLEDETFPKNPELALIASGARRQFLSSKEWALNDGAQKGIFRNAVSGIFSDFFRGDEDYSWERAIYEYAWENQKRGLESLGHILHLLEDATVPDHTRNDPHPPFLEMGSPYEAWAKKFNQSNIEINPSEKKPVIFSKLGIYFDELAKFSNNNFFSKDTILIPRYDNPVFSVEKDEIIQGQTFRFGYSNGRDIPEYRLVRIKKRFGDNKTEYSIEDSSNLILSGYWSILSEQAVIHGAGAIKLFFAEVETERKTKILYEKNRSWFSRQLDKFWQTAFGLAGLLYGTSVEESDLAGLNQSDANADAQAKNSLPPQPKISSALPKPLSAKPLPAPAPQINENKKIIGEKPAIAKNISRNTSTLVPIMGGGGASVTSSQGSNSQSQNNESENSAGSSGGGTNNSSNNPASTLNSSSGNASGSGAGQSAFLSPSDTNPPLPPTISNIPQKFTATSTTIIFSGSAEASSTISANFSSSTAPVDSSGGWTLALNNLPQGSSTILFFATDQAGNVSLAFEQSVFVDSLGPQTHLIVSACNASLTQTGCLLATTTIFLQWNSSDPDFSYYSLECSLNGSACPGFLSATTTSTSTVYASAQDKSKYTFTIKTFDIYGNEGTAQTQTIEISTRPLVINEVAWAGTSAARDQDEWIELKNTTDKTLNLSGWVLRSKSDNTPYIPLSGSIGPQSYFLLERTNDATISTVFANQIYTGALNNLGEALELSYASTTADTTPEIALCAGWCGGVAGGQYLSLERFDPLLSGESASNWGNGAALFAPAKNADNLDVNGTPGKKNSISYLISKSGGLAQDKILTKAGSPYLVSNNFNIASGTTLTLEPGAIVKFLGQSAGLNVRGAIRAEGTLSDPVVFTSIKDDSFGGDANEDGATTTPAAGDWLSIKILSPGSVFDRTIIRYGGGKDFLAEHWANLRVDNVSVSVKNSVIEKSGVYGVWSKGGLGVFAGNTIWENNNSLQGVGMVAEAGDLLIKNNAFNDNRVGLLLTGAGLPNNFQVSGNNFSNNSEEAINVNGALPLFSANSASGNGKNGIIFQGVIGQNYSFSTDLPYIIAISNSVSSTGVLSLPAGAVIKFLPGANWNIRGILLANGAPGNPVVFTSFADDSFGGDTNNDGASTAPSAGDWKYLMFDNSVGSSTLRHAVIRFGGTKGRLDSDRGALILKNSSVEIQNSTIEDNYWTGASFMDSPYASVMDSIIQNHQTPASDPAFGILASNSTVYIQNTQFKNNKFGLQTSNSSTIQNGGGNTFQGNVTDTNPPGLLP